MKLFMFLGEYVADHDDYIVRAETAEDAAELILHDDPSLLRAYGLRDTEVDLAVYAMIRRAHLRELKTDGSAEIVAQGRGML
jgi:hypothetical protein